MPRIPTSKTSIGIDPGGSGGIVFLQNGHPQVHKMPATERDICDLVFNYVGTDCFAYIEKVSGYIGTAHPGSAMFKFGVSYGGLRMALVAHGIPFEEVAPRTWQKALGVPPRNKKKNESKAKFKNRLKAKGQQLFPGIKITLATCDALLIAEYGRRTRK